MLVLSKKFYPQHLLSALYLWSTRNEFRMIALYTSELKLGVDFDISPGDCLVV